MQLGDDMALVGQNVEIPLTLTTEQEVQGLVAAFNWNGTIGIGVNLLMGSDLMSIPPDLWVTRVEPDYMVLGMNYTKEKWMEHIEEAFDRVRP